MYRRSFQSQLRNYCSQNCNSQKIYVKAIISWPNSPELTGRQEVVGPPVDVVDRYIKTGGDNTAFDDATSEIDYNFVGPVVVNNLEFSNVSILHHDCEEFDNYL